MGYHSKQLLPNRIWAYRALHISDGDIYSGVELTS